MREGNEITKTFDIRKRPTNCKILQNERPSKQDFIVHTKKAMGKKYMQESIFKSKGEKPEKQLREIVMSEQFIRSSKLYRLLKEKMQMNDALYMKELNHINEKKMKLKGEIMELKSKTYQEKISLWEMKNQLMELRMQKQQEEDESRDLDRRAELFYQQGGSYEPGEEEENEMEEGSEPRNSSAADETQSQKCNSEGQREEEQQEIYEGPQSKNMVSSDTAKFSQILEEIMELRAAKKVEQFKKSLNALQQHQSGDREQNPNGCADKDKSQASEVRSSQQNTELNPEKEQSY